MQGWRRRPHVTRAPRFSLRERLLHVQARVDVIDGAGELELRQVRLINAEERCDRDELFSGDIRVLAGKNGLPTLESQVATPARRR